MVFFIFNDQFDRKKVSIYLYERKKKWEWFTEPFIAIYLWYKWYISGCNGSINSYWFSMAEPCTINYFDDNKVKSIKWNRRLDWWEVQLSSQNIHKIISNIVAVKLILFLSLLLSRPTDWIFWLVFCLR